MIKAGLQKSHEEEKDVLNRARNLERMKRGS